MHPRPRETGTFAYARSTTRHKHRFTACAIVAVCLVLGSVWFIFVSRFWSVTQLDIKGMKDLGRGEVEQATYGALDHGSWKPWDQRNIFFVDTNQLAKEIQQKLFAEKVTVEKSYPNVLRLLIAERQRRVVYVIGPQYYDVDTQGVVNGIDTVNASFVQSLLNGKSVSDTSHPVVVSQQIFNQDAADTFLFVSSTNIGATGASSTDINTDSATTSQQLVDSDQVKRWLDLSEALNGARLHFKVLKVMQPTSRAVSVAMDKGYDLVMDLLTPFGPQIDTYQKFICMKRKTQAINQYVDVRVPGKIFLK